MKRRLLLAGICAFWGSTLVPVTARAFDFTQRSVSHSQQFIIYCPDVGLRMAVTSYVETAKDLVLETLGIGDHWKIPIVLNLQRPRTEDAAKPLCQVNLLN